MRHTTTKKWTKSDQVNGSRNIKWILRVRVLEHKVSGETKMGSAIGEESRFRSTYQRVKDTRAFGKTPKKSAAFLESTSYLMTRTLENLHQGLRKLMKTESMLTL